MSESMIEGRTVVRYEHPSLEQWKYPHPQRDYFCLVLPKQKPAGQVPLRVILHSAGGGGDSEMRIVLKDPHNINAYTDESSYGLYLDCLGNRATDWWWGWESIRNSPQSFENALTPTESRLLSSVKWVMENFPIDTNQVYLSGGSMGGSGSLGLGMCRGDIFAAISVVVPAGVGHVQYRMKHGQHPEPPPILDLSCQNDSWAEGQERLIADCQSNRYALVFAWGPYGHAGGAAVGNETGAGSYPWRSIRKNEAYPVFTGATSDKHYPGFQKTTDPDQVGQINAFFRWKNLTDTPEKFVMELRLARKDEFPKPVEIPVSSTADVTLRRLQKFPVKPGQSFRWQFATGQSGRIKADAGGLLTIPQIRVTDVPGQLQISRDE